MYASDLHPILMFVEEIKCITGSIYDLHGGGSGIQNFESSYVASYIMIIAWINLAQHPTWGVKNKKIENTKKMNYYTIIITNPKKETKQTK